jgi:proprotein convertase subtilisin/kexin type 5
VFPTSSSTTTCQACPTGCFNCAFCSNCWRYVNCTLCRTGFSLVKFTYTNNNQFVCSCPSGSFPNATTNTCMGCTAVMPNCVSCYAGSSGHYSATCATCASGFYGAGFGGSWQGSTKCDPCAAGCSACSVSASNCTGCFTGFSKVGANCICSVAGTYYNAATGTCTNCVLAIPNCATCVLGTTTTCSACLSGFYLSGSTCVACQPNCNTCVAGSCSSCKATFVASGASCVCSTTPQMVLNVASTACVLCTTVVPSCSVCGGSGAAVTCATCASGTYPATTTSCLTCPTTCATCSAATCLTCLNNLIVVGTGCDCNNAGGYYLNTLTNTCISCPQTFPACINCQMIATVLSCTACDPAGFFVTPSGCSACPTTCKTCTDASTCLTCVDGYQLGYGVPAGDCGCLNCVPCATAGVANCAICDLTTPGS